MSASIVYEGAVRGGLLFNGNKFFVLQRVPQRSTFIEKIKANGGEDVKLEKNADFIIADHARADAPPNSISWRWIDDCISQGRMLDADDYPATKRQSTAQNPRPSGGTKTTRTPYTAADDRILTQWVRGAERAGKSTKGNIIYQELAAKYPHHTYQSWQARWTKNLVYLQGSSNVATAADDCNGQANDEHADIMTSEDSVAATARKPATIVTTSVITSPNKPSTRRTSSDVQKSAPVKPSILPSAVPSLEDDSVITVEDEKLLLEQKGDILNLDPEKSDAAWDAWAKAYKRHSAARWRSHWENVMLKQVSQPTIKSTSSEAIATDPANPGDTSVAKEGPHGVTSSNVASRNGAIDSAELPSQTLDDIDKQREFYGHLKTFAEKNKQVLNMSPEVCGRIVKLHQLFGIVFEGHSGADNVDDFDAWNQVAAQMEFDPLQFPKAGGLLRKEYRKQLYGFEECYEMWMENENGLGLGYTLVEESLFVSDEEDNAVSSSARASRDTKRPSSTPQPLEAQEGQKRRRIDKGKAREIPGTPEHESTPSFSRLVETAQTPTLTSPNRSKVALQPSSMPAPNGAKGVNGSSSHVEIDPEAELREYMDKYISLSTPQHIIVDALAATCMHTGDAHLVMESLMKGDGIPSNIQGVWTEEDDRDLQNQFGDRGLGYRRVISKHGKKRCDARMEFLKQWNEVD